MLVNDQLSIHMQSSVYYALYGLVEVNGKQIAIFGIFLWWSMYRAKLFNNDFVSNQLEWYCCACIYYVCLWPPLPMTHMETRPYKLTSMLFPGGPGFSMAIFIPAAFRSLANWSKSPSSLISLDKGPSEGKEALISGTNTFGLSLWRRDMILRFPCTCAVRCWVKI